MRAVYIQSHGQTDSVVVGERPTPEPGPGEVRVKVKVGGFNHVDLYMRDTGAGITHELPLILGVDGAGVVDAVGEGVTTPAVGDAVVLYPLRFGDDEFVRRGDVMLTLDCKIMGEHIDGAFADYVCMPAHSAYPIPEGLSFEQAAVLPTAYLTAWRMVMTQGQVRPGDSVLIHGVGGGVSLAAMLFCKLAGAMVIVTSSSGEKLERARELGADETINYRDEDVAKRVMAITGGRGVDLVVENVGEATWGTSLRCAVRGGRIVVCGATSGPNPKADLQRIFIRQLHISGATLGTEEEFRRLLLCAGRGDFTPVIDRGFAFDEAREGLAYLDAAKQFGKLVLHVND